MKFPRAPLTALTFLGATLAAPAATPADRVATVTGTPGCGKTTFAQLLSAACSLKQLVVGELVKEKGLHEGWDEVWEACVPCPSRHENM